MGDHPVVIYSLRALDAVITRVALGNRPGSSGPHHQIGAQVRSNNPVLTRPDAFLPLDNQNSGAGYRQASYPQGGYGQAGYTQPGYAQAGYAQPGFPPPGTPADGFDPQYGGGAPTARMTMNDVIAKTATLFVVLLVAAAASWIFTAVNPILALPLAMLSGVVALVSAIVVTVRRSTSVPAIMIYTLFEGVLIGAFSQIMEMAYPGIVSQAVLGTFAAAGVTLFAYRTFGARISGRMQKIFLFSILGYAGVAAVSLVAMLFGVNFGLFDTGPSAGPLSWLMAGVGVVLAVVSLLLDFEEVERGVQMGVPAKESWRAGFGLMVTMVWLYTNILRILSFFRN